MRQHGHGNHQKVRCGQKHLRLNQKQLASTMVRMDRWFAYSLFHTRRSNFYQRPAQLDRQIPLRWPTFLRTNMPKHEELGLTANTKKLLECLNNQNKIMTDQVANDGQEYARFRIIPFNEIKK